MGQMNGTCVIMIFMWKRLPPGITILVLAVSLLLPLLAVLQYRWLGQVSEAERELVRSVTAGVGEYYGTRAYQGG